MKKAGQLISEIISLVYPSGAPENLLEPVLDGQKSPFRQVFDFAFADIAQYVPCEKTKNINLVEFCKTNFKNAMTILEKPRGKVTRLFTVDSNDYTRPVYYQQVDWPLPEMEARRWALVVKSTATTNLPVGFLPADASTDSPAGRAHGGIWCIHDGNIYMWPWIQSTELVAIEWDGTKEEWGDNDIVTGTQLYKKAVTDFFMYRSEYHWGSKMKMADALEEYRKTYSDLMTECHENTKRLIQDVPPIVPDRHFPGFFASSTLSNSDVRGSIPIPAGANGGQVTGLNLSFTPRFPTLTVIGPVNGFILTANVQGAMTADGFTYVLSGITDSGLYILSYELS